MGVIGSQSRVKIQERNLWKMLVSTLIPCRTSKIKIECYFLTLLIFVTEPKFQSLLTWNTNNSRNPLKSFHAQKLPHFWNPQDMSFHMLLSWKKFTLTKMSRRREFGKKRRFWPFFVSAPKNFQLAANLTNLNSGARIQDLGFRTNTPV